MNNLFFRINGQWLRYDLDNSKPLAIQSKDDGIDLSDNIFKVIEDDKECLRKLTDLAYAPAFGLNELIENPSEIKNALCSFNLAQSDNSKDSLTYHVSAAFCCEIDINDEIPVTAKVFEKILTELKTIDQKPGEAYCSLLFFLKESYIIELLQIKDYGYGFPKLTDFFDFAMDAVNEKFTQGHNIFFDTFIECAHNIAFHDEKQPEKFSFSTDLEMQYYTSSMTSLYGFDLEQAPDEVVQRFRDCMEYLSSQGDACGLYYIGKVSVLDGNRVFPRDVKTGEEYLHILLEDCDDEEFTHSDEVCTLLGDLYSADSELGEADYDKAFKYYSIAEKYGSKMAINSIFKLLLDDRIEHIPSSLVEKYSDLLKKEITDSSFFLFKAANDYVAAMLVSLGDECRNNADYLAIACYDYVKDNYLLKALKYYLEAQKCIELLMKKGFDFNLVKLNDDLESKIDEVKSILKDKCNHKEITISTDKILEKFDYIVPLMKQSGLSFMFEYNKKTKVLSITADNTEYLDDVNFICCIPECSFCEYVDRIILNVDNIDFLPKDERFDFEDTIEVPFDAIDGFTLKEGDEEVATINKTFTIRISDQTASEYEVENS